MKRLVIIGHIVNDTEPYNHMGGSVAYISVAAKQLGVEAHVVTKCPQNHPYIKELQEKGVIVHILPTLNPKFEDKITTFKNVYDSITAHRKQTVLEIAETITLEDFRSFPQEILQDSTIVIGTVIAEVRENLFPKLARFGQLTILAQGYVRKIQSDMTITQKSWQGFENELKDSRAIVILSEEDFTCNESKETNLLTRLIDSTNKTIVTRGEKGSIIYNQSKKIQINAFPANSINDLTGAGDVFSAAFLLGLDLFKDDHQAGLFASVLATLKIENTSGIGLNSIPTKNLLQIYIQNHKDNIEQYLSNNLQNKLESGNMFQRLLEF